MYSITRHLNVTVPLYPVTKNMCNILKQNTFDTCAEPTCILAKPLAFNTDWMPFCQHHFLNRETETGTALVKMLDQTAHAGLPAHQCHPHSRYYAGNASNDWCQSFFVFARSMQPLRTLDIHPRCLRDCARGQVSSLKESSYAPYYDTVYFEVYIYMV